MNRSKHHVQHWSCAINKHKKKTAVLLILLVCGLNSFAQQIPDSVEAKELEEVLFAVSKWELKQNEVPNKITKINKEDLVLGNPQTAADMLSQTGAVFVQKSQLGGGSPMIRGFATNRVLIVVDGVRMNNAIFRSGNVHNVIAVDPLALETAEVIFGPGSLLYGSDAIGGVMDFHSLQPRLAENNKTRYKGNALVRHSTGNKEQTYHADFNVGKKRWSFLSSATYSAFDDVKMGKHGGQPSYLRPEYVRNINGIDRIINNDNSSIQRFSGYDQWNLLEKIRFKPNKHLDLLYSFTYSGTSTVPRYDRLLVYRAGKPRFAEWNYGPMLWRMHNFRMLYTKKTALHDELKYTLAFQQYEESRNERERNNPIRKTQREAVTAITLTADLNKKLGKGTLYYGLDLVHNKIRSSGFTAPLGQSIGTAIPGRYPDKSKWNAGGVYASYTVNLNDRLTYSGGARYSYNLLQANLSMPGIHNLFQDINIKEGALTGNGGLVYRANKGWQLSLNLSSGYRTPNIDDLAKVFESTPGFLMIPNPNLRAEFAYNLELGIRKIVPGKLQLEMNLFYSTLNNAITRRPTALNGTDSILFEGQYKKLESLQNVAYATVWGIQANMELWMSQHLSLTSHANYIKGRETDDQFNTQVPLRHAPPFYGNTALRYKARRIIGEISWMHNSSVKHESLAPSEKNKPEIYASDSQGRPYAPGWYTLNLKGSFQFNKQFQVTAGWENLTNRLYRSYASGIVAVGSNLILSLRASL